MTLMLLMNLDFAGGQAEVLDDNFDFGYAAPGARFDYAAPATVLDYAAPAERMEYAAP